MNKDCTPPQVHYNEALNNGRRLLCPPQLQFASPLFRARLILSTRSKPGLLLGEITSAISAKQALECPALGVGLRGPGASMASVGYWREFRSRQVEQDARILELTENLLLVVSLPERHGRRGVMFCHGRQQ